MRRTQPLRDRVARELRSHPDAARRLLQVVGAVHLGSAASRLARVTVPAAGQVTAELPGGGVVRMDSIANRDQSALALARGWDTFEAPMPAVFLQLCRSFPGLVLDIGANTGIYALLAAVGCGRSVVAFEPIPELAAMLERNAALSRVTERVSVDVRAVGSSESTATIYLPPDDGGYVETSASLSPDFKQVIGTELEVQVTTLDAAFSDSAELVAIVKVDVESREADVLLGAEKLIGRDRPLLFVEILPQGDAVSIADFAERHDYLDVVMRVGEATIGGRPAYVENAWNHLLIPREHEAQVRSELIAAGLAVKTGVVL